MKLERDIRTVMSRVVVVPVGFTAVLLALAASPASAETHGYIVSWFATATNNPDFAQNCPQAAQNQDRVKFVVTAGGQRRDRALVNGKPVSPLNYPEALQKEPDYEPVAGKYAYGFDLGGSANKFTDIETHEQIDNQLWRALGCNRQFQSTPPRSPYFQEEGWMNYFDSSPAWIMQVSGADLSKDGPVTVTVDRALRHGERDALGGARSYVSYVIDPTPRSHNVLSGEIKNGALLVKSGYLYLEGAMTWYGEIDLKDAHMRIHSEPGKLVGYWGGYTDWHRWAYQCTSRPSSGCDGVQYYYALQKYADGDPDPVTGKNRAISTTWRMEAVPAYLTTVGGKVAATASGEGLGGVVHQATVDQDTAH